MRRALVATTTAAMLAVAAAGPAAAQADELIAELPEDLQKLYVGYPGEITASELADFPAVEGPWKVCHSESFQGNPWRVAVTNEMQRIADEFAEAGKVSEFKVSDSNNDTQLQITQMQAFIDEGCDIITTIPGSATGLDEVIADANEAGIPVVSFAGAVTSPYAVNVDSNWYGWGYDMGVGLGEGIGEGNIIVVEGIAGAPIVAMQAQGLADALADNPGLNVVATVNGDWTPTTTKTVVLQTLATNPSEIDGVWTSGSETRLVTEAFDEAGRDVPLVTGSMTGDALGYWNENPDGFIYTGNAVLPHPAANSAIRVAFRILEGQGPKLNTMLVPLPPITMADLPDWYGECMTSDSATVFPIAPSDPYPEEMLDAYFSAGAATPPYDYANTPSPCG